MKFNKFRVFGLIMIVLGVILFFTTGLETIIRPITQPILMGSSKGKDILFFVLFGITLILSTILDNEKIYSKIKSLNIKDKYKSTNFYLKIVIILFLILSILGLLLEIYLRYKFGVGINTIFVSLNPNFTSTSLLHSHMYKSILGTIIGSILIYIPAGIHTGSSLAIYTPKIANYLFILIPILYIIIIMALQRRNPISRVVLAFAGSIGIIGLMDGGFFATPTVGGLYLFLIVLINGTNLEFSDFKKSITNTIKINFLSRKKWKNWLPHIITLFIIILRFSIAIYGANDMYYEVDIYNPSEDIDLSEYNTLNITESQNKTTVLISNEYNEMELLNSLGQKLNGKCDCYTQTWNFNSYLTNTTPCP